MSVCELHIIYVAEDGITTLTCGVGTIAHHFISAFPEIAEKCLNHKIKLKLSIITFAASTDSVGVRSDLLAKVRTVCAAFQGEIYFIEPESSHSFEYFDFNTWEKYNRKANDIITDIVKADEGNFLVIANDTIFAKTRCFNPQVINVWIPHSLSEIHAQSYADNIKRREWESHTIQAIQTEKNYFVGYISEFAKHQIEQTFSLSEDYLVPCLNGFYFPNLQKYIVSQSLIESELKRRHIPTERDMIFAFGRADEYKGLDIALEAMILAAEKYDFQGVLIASTFSKEPIVSSVQKQLQLISQATDADVKLFLDYEFELPKYILQCAKTKFLLNLSTKDFCPLIPHEAELIGHENLCIINSDIDCFRSIIEDGQNGFLSPPNAKEVLSTVEKIKAMPEGDKRIIFNRGKLKTLAERNIVNNYFQLIQSLVSKTFERCGNN